MAPSTKYPDCDAATAAKPGPVPEVIARLAELIWDKEGRPAGREREFRLQAEAALRTANGATRDETQF